MVVEPCLRIRTTAQKVQTSMCGDHDIVISLITARLGLHFYLFFFCIL